MWEPKCRLTIANKFFSGGSVTGNPNITVPTLGQLQPQIKKGYTFQTNQFPTEKATEATALDFMKGLGGYVSPVLSSMGALPPELLRNAEQQSLGLQSAQGTARTTGGLANTILNTEAAREARLTNAANLGTTALNYGIGATASKLGVLNPILSSILNLTGLQTQADIEGAKIGAAGDIAGKQSQSDIIGGIASSIGSVVGAAVGSDERIKTKIRDTGIKTEDGIPFKVFEYATRPGVKFLGHMAQDVERKRPDAVITDPVSGLKMIDFYKLGSRMVQLNSGGKEPA
jgi:hypothetical protein